MKESDCVSQRKPLITFLSLEQAREGFTFIHKGSASKCAGCKYFPVCVKNLEIGRVYRAVRLREKTVQCELTGKDLVVAEVVESAIEAGIPCQQAIEGAIIAFRTQECSIEECRNYAVCVPTGLVKGDRCKIVEVTGCLECLRSFPLEKVVLLRVPAS